jgi:hypothetical protein
MSDYSRFISWDARCTDRGGYGMTPGDTLHLGLRDYNEMYPCPNGLPVQTGGPQKSEAWQKRLAKAKQFIEQWNTEQRVDRLAEAITDEQLDLFLELMKG